MTGMSRRSVLRGSAGVALAGVANGCAIPFTQSTTRYRMTVDVTTPVGRATGSTVAEVWMERMPTFGCAYAQSFNTRVTAESVVIDLPDRTTLFTVMAEPGSGASHSLFGHSMSYAARYGRSEPPLTPDDLKGDLGEISARIRQLRPVLHARLNDYPMLVRFADPAKPQTVEIVYSPKHDRNWANITAVTFELTDDPVSHVVKERLPWLANPPWRLVDPDKGPIDPSRTEASYKERLGLDARAFVRIDK